MRPSKFFSLVFIALTAPNICVAQNVVKAPSSSVSAKDLAINSAIEKFNNGEDIIKQKSYIRFKSPLLTEGVIGNFNCESKNPIITGFLDYRQGRKGKLPLDGIKISTICSGIAQGKVILEGSFGTQKEQSIVYWSEREVGFFFNPPNSVPIGAAIKIKIITADGRKSNWVSFQ